MPTTQSVFEHRCLQSQPLTSVIYQYSCPDKLKMFSRSEFDFLNVGGSQNASPVISWMLLSLLFPPLLAYGTFQLIFPVETAISPLARMLVYATLPSGEVIASSADFQVENCLPNKVSIRQCLCKPCLPCCQQFSNEFHCEKRIHKQFIKWSEQMLTKS